MKRRAQAKSWALAAVVAVTVSVLLGLGFWQLQRADEKRELLLQQDQQRNLPPLKAVSLNQKLPEFRAIVVRGQFDTERYWLLENRIHQGRYGFELVSPFVVTSGETLLVHRGWLPGDGSRRTLPTVKTPAGEVVLTGTIDRGGVVGFELEGAEESDGWPKRVQWLPTERAALALGVEVPDLLLRLSEGEPGMYEQTYSVVNMPPQKHLGYAVQWFGMAAIIIFLFLLRLWRQYGSRGTSSE